MKTLRGLASFTGIALSTDAVHGNRDGFVHLRRDRSQGHGGRCAAFQYIFYRLNIAQRYRRPCGAEGKEVFERNRICGVDDGGECLIIGVGT